MKSRLTLNAVATALLLVASQPATAVTITFDEFAAGNSNTALTALYAPLGVTFGADNSGTWGGLGQGNPGNWLLEGTNGSAFLGNNGINNSNSFMTSIHFADALSSLSLDVARANGSGPAQAMTASVYQGANLLSSQAIVFGGVNSWTSVAFAIDGISSVVIASTNGGFAPFGIDNLQFATSTNLSSTQVSPIPEPETYALMIAGLGLLGFVARRRTKNAAAA